MGTPSAFQVYRGYTSFQASASDRQCHGQFTGGAVGADDYIFLSANWLTASSCACIVGFWDPDDPGSDLVSAIGLEALPLDLGRRADLNRDGTIDYLDVRIFERDNGLPDDLSRAMKETMESSKRKRRSR